MHQGPAHVPREILPGLVTSLANGFESPSEGIFLRKNRPPSGVVLALSTALELLRLQD